MGHGQKRPNEEDSNPNGEGHKPGKNNKRCRRNSSPRPGPSSAASGLEECFTCHLCTEKCVQFSLLKDLIRHLTTHTNEKPYTCESFCGYRTDRHENYARHLTKGKHKMSKKEASDKAKAVALKYLKKNMKDKEKLRGISASRLQGAVRKVVLEKCNMLPKPKYWRPTDDSILQEAIGSGVTASSSNAIPNLEPSFPLVSHNEDESLQEQAPEMMERQSNERDHREDVVDLAASIRNAVNSVMQLVGLEAEQPNPPEMDLYENGNGEVIRGNVDLEQEDDISSTSREPEAERQAADQLQLEAMESPSVSSSSQRELPNEEMGNEIGSVQNDISSRNPFAIHNSEEDNHVGIGANSLVNQETWNTSRRLDVKYNALAGVRQQELDWLHHNRVNGDMVEANQNAIGPTFGRPEIMFLLTICVAILLWHCFMQ